MVRRLRKAGAIILGKASMSEWAGFRFGFPWGWCARTGQGQVSYELLIQNSIFLVFVILYLHPIIFNFSLRRRKGFMYLNNLCPWKNSIILQLYQEVCIGM